MKQKHGQDAKAKHRPASSPEALEAEMVSLAFETARKRMLEGNATSQEIVYFLKLGAERERSEREILELKKELMVAQKEALESSARSEEAYVKALEAFRSYSGYEDYDEEL